MDNIWAVILAAGASTRMKTQKLLLPYRGKSIIETVVHAARSLVHDNIVVVLGSHHEQIRKQIGMETLTYVVNPDYMEGMHTSVICGFRAVPRDARAVLVFLGDQPHVPENVARILAEAWHNHQKGIFIPVFEGRRGHPVLFDIGYLPDIENLDPAQGLRSVISNNKSDIFEVECQTPEILTDVDTPVDYELIIKQQTNIQHDEGEN